MWVIFCLLSVLKMMMMMYLPSLHQERVPPQLRLLVHLESAEEENSCHHLHLHLPHHLHLFIFTFSLWRHFQEQNECVPLKLTHWCNFTRLNSSEMNKFCLVPHVRSSGSSWITHMKWATPSGFYSWMFVTLTVRTNILIFLLQWKEKQWKRLQDFFQSSFLFSRYDSV